MIEPPPRFIGLWSVWLLADDTNKRLLLSHPPHLHVNQSIPYPTIPGAGSDMFSLLDKLGEERVQRERDMLTDAGYEGDDEEGEWEEEGDYDDEDEEDVEWDEDDKDEDEEDDDDEFEWEDEEDEEEDGDGLHDTAAQRAKDQADAEQLIAMLEGLEVRVCVLLCVSAACA